MRHKFWFLASLAASCHSPAGTHVTDAAVDVGVDSAFSGTPTVNVDLPRNGIAPNELGVIVDDNNPTSIAVAAHYQLVRPEVPAGNYIHISIPQVGSAPPSTLTQVDFTPLKSAVDLQTAAIEAAATDGHHIQAYALTFIHPFSVDNMSIGSAFALGYLSISITCNINYRSDYIDDDSTKPFDDFQIRPTMILGGVDQAGGIALIDRGKMSDGTFPSGSAYFVQTADPVRSMPRDNSFKSLVASWDSATGIDTHFVDLSAMTPDDLTGKTNLLIYEIGRVNVPNLDTNSFVPGAIADHLTSFGGQLNGDVLDTGSGQMSELLWIAGGATGSYGSAIEPCNWPDKFPNPTYFLPHYFRGESLIEAYWKSVSDMSEGNFVGDPLASPWGKNDVKIVGQGASTAITIRTTWFRPGITYTVEAGDSESGPFDTVGSDVKLDKYELTTIQIANANRAYYHLHGK